MLPKVFVQLCNGSGKHALLRIGASSYDRGLLLLLLLGKTLQAIINRGRKGSGRRIGSRSQMIINLTTYKRRGRLLLLLLLVLLLLLMLLLLLLKSDRSVNCLLLVMLHHVGMATHWEGTHAQGSGILESWKEENACSIHIRYELQNEIV